MKQDKRLQRNVRNRVKLIEESRTYPNTKTKLREHF